MGSDPTITGYQTVRTAAMVRNDKRQPTKFREHLEDNNDATYNVPRQTMAKTRNKYRPKSSRPSECDDMLFGKPAGYEFKEWKAPWDNSKTATPLLFDSTDRVGHYSPEKQNNNPLRQSTSAKVNHKRAWR